MEQGDNKGEGLGFDSRRLHCNSDDLGDIAAAGAPGVPSEIRRRNYEAWRTA